MSSPMDTKDLLESKRNIGEPACQFLLECQRKKYVKPTLYSPDDIQTKCHTDPSEAATNDSRAGPEEPEVG